VEFDVAEDFRVRMEVHFGPAPFGLSDHRQRSHGVAVAEFHRMRLTVAADCKLEQVGKRIDNRDANAVQPAGNLVAVTVELAAGVQYGHHDFCRRPSCFVLRMNACRNVDHADRVVRMDDDLDLVAMPRQRLVDRVVEHFEHHVMQAGAIAGVANVHARTLAHRFQAFQYLDAVGIVFRGGHLCLYR